MKLEYGIEKIRGNYYKLDVNGVGYKAYKEIYMEEIDNVKAIKVLESKDKVLIMALYYGWGYRGYTVENSEKDKIKDLGNYELMIKYKELRNKNVMENRTQ